MSSPSPEPHARIADWEAFYRDYRKPGYVAGFEITSKLGGGMFGLVFRARRMSIGKDYAIKFLQVEDETVQKAVLAELEQVKWFAQIDHPNLVSIEDRGEVDGIPFLVMAFAGTETLRDRMPAGRAPSPEEKDELLRYFLQACRGLAALHERSLVHFDVKPANVFLKGGVARVGDYGLSKLVTHSRGSLSMGRGTPYYMAPELLQRRGDHRSDVYSLGVLLYELLCGRVPFTGDSEWEVLKQHETKQPELPDHLTPRERAVLQRCLQKDPAARFQSVHDVIAACGAPAGVAAAAWSDVQAKSGRIAPPPLPSAAGPAPAGAAAGAGGEEDPVAGLGRASRDALRHAGTLAQRAAKEATRIAQEAAAQAQRAVQDAFDRSRTYGTRRWSALKILRKRHRGEDARGRTLEVAAAVAAGPRQPRRRRVGPALLGLGVALAAIAFAFVMVAPGGPSPSVVWTSGGAQSARVDADTFASIDVGRFHGSVQTEEPKWVRYVPRDLDTAKSLLQQHAHRLRSVAPLEETQRVRVVQLPKFEQSRAARAAGEAARGLVEEFLRREQWDDAIARELADSAPASLVAAAQALQQLDLRDPADLARARRLQRWLERTTRCDELRLIEGDRCTPDEIAAVNRDLGTLWLWFVNEFAHTPRTWTAYRALVR
jgi:hypothetical protein